MLANLLRSSFVLGMLIFSLSFSLYGEEVEATGASDAVETGEGVDSQVRGSENRVHLIPESLEQTALADESVKKQIVWLGSSEGRKGGDISFLALEIYEKAAESQGAVLFLHGVEQHPNWPQVIKPLRTILPDDGWYTLSVMLPYANYQPTPSRDLQTKLNESVESSDTAPRFSGRYVRPGSSENNNSEEDSSGTGDDAESDSKPDAAESVNDETPEAEPTETAADLALKDSAEEVIDISADEKASAPSAITFEEKVQMRLKVGLDHIAEKGYQNVVLVGYQQGAQGILDYLSNNKGFLPENGLTVVWVDAVLTEEQVSRFGDSVGKEFSLKMLDVVDSSSRKGISDGKKRLGQARRNSYLGYSLVKLPIADLGRMELSTLTQRVRGWLKVSAPGMQPGKAN